eukprot:TRINITY_DN2666_c0_g1_i1.p1 TRINITY_DN2666_c0_g1~~TRINITY_DN2666_c0_g1_i1.p1  ORF type:complete len:433 (+),score=87.10 TRINITY_DN2666_c0_g1_i1:26-1300(+)
MRPPRMCMSLLAAFLVWLPLLYVHAHYETYEGYQVVRATLTSSSHVDAIKKLDLDVWSDDSLVHVGQVDVMVNASHLALLDGMHIDYTIFVQDVAALVRTEKQRLDVRPKVHFNLGGDASWHDSYHTYTEIVTYLQQMARSFPRLMGMSVIGQSIEGRDIVALRVSGTVGTNKKRIFVQGGQHAREWIGPATVVYITEQLVTKYATDPDTRSLMDRTEFYIVPLLNPDGYNFTWTSQRLWRKNRRLVQGSTYGVDLNRNWAGENWCDYGASKTPSSDTYCGTHPFSEPETLASASFMSKYAPFVGAIDYHSKSQLMLRCWGYTQDVPSDEYNLKLVGDGYSAALNAQSGKVYTSMPSWQLYYTTGSAQDYWKGQSPNIPFSYTVELRPLPDDPDSWMLPPDQIIPTGEENWAGFKFFTNEVTSI